MSNALFNNPKLMARVRGAIEVGASIGEEIPEWERFKISNQIFIEPIAELFEVLEPRAKQQVHNPNVKCFNIALSDIDGESDFHISTGSYCSSSLLDFSKEAIRIGLTYQSASVRKVQVRRLDSLVESGDIHLPDYNLLFVDVQGNEFKLMKGAEKSLPSFDFVFCEVNFIQVYEGATLWGEFREYMISQGFKLLNIRTIHETSEAQGEALFINKNVKW